MAFAFRCDNPTRIVTLIEHREPKGLSHRQGTCGERNLSRACRGSRTIVALSPPWRMSRRVSLTDEEPNVAQVVRPEALVLPALT